MTKSNHKVPIVRITELLKHPNAESLSLVKIGGYQLVVKTANYKVGDLAVFIQPDSLVPQSAPFEFLWADKEFQDGVVPEKYRRVTVRRFRKEYSEGLLLPVWDFPTIVRKESRHAAGGLSGYDYCAEVLKVAEGDDVAELLGVTHYNPPEPEERNVARKQQYKWPPKSLRGWLYYLLHLIGIDLNGPVGGTNEKGPSNPPPIYDIESYKNFVGVFEPEELVVVSEKIHGSNARFLFDGKKLFVGSRKLWKSEKSSCVWRKAVDQNPWIEKWCRENPGHTLFGEVTPTQSGFTYGSENGQVTFFAFDVLTPDGKWMKPWAVDKGCVLTWQSVEQIVPILWAGPYSEDAVKERVDGQSQVFGANHIREGVVVSPVEERHVHGLGRLQVKLVSNSFLEKAVA